MMMKWMQMQRVGCAAAARRRIRRRRMERLGRAFSLIEVLIAILILALGLLGLGAIIPVVVREQRVAAEGTRAVIAANNAQAYLEARPDLNRLEGAVAPRSGAGGGGPGLGGSSAPLPMGFGVWLENLNWSDTYLWEDSARLWHALYRTSGDLRPLGNGIGTTIPMRDRLWPEPSSGGEPQLVWDFAARRVAPSDPRRRPRDGEMERTIEIAVFVRRIDPGIRVPAGQTRAGVLLDPRVAPGQRPKPVGVNAQGPTGDGSGDYSTPVTLRAEIAPGSRRDILRLAVDGASWASDFASRPGQRLVDNSGNVYTVLRRSPETGPTDIVVTPPVPAISRLQQVVFTPQIPAAVKVFRITIPRMPAVSPNGSGAGMRPWFGEVGQTP